MPHQPVSVQVRARPPKTWRADRLSRGLRWIPALCLLAPIGGVSGCGPSNSSATTALDVVVDTVGDTVVVRTLAGSVWGEARHLAPETSIGELDG